MKQIFGCLGLIGVFVVAAVVIELAIGLPFLLIRGGGWVWVAVILTAMALFGRFISRRP